MDYRDFNDYTLIRLDKGDDIIASLKRVAIELSIHLGQVTGLGACNHVKLGCYDPVEKMYYEREFQGLYEISSLNGNITTMQGEAYLHVHATFSDVHMQVVGGHLAEGIVSATAELIVAKIKGQQDRRFDETIGLNILLF